MNEVQVESQIRYLTRVFVSSQSRNVFERNNKIKKLIKKLSQFEI